VRDLKRDWMRRIAYGKNDIHNIHRAQNKVPYFGVVVTIACEYQPGCDNMVREHLPIVLSSFLNIDGHDLLQPERILNQRVPLLQSSNLPIGPVGPERFHV
jgi:hypothetical protein